MLTTTAPVAHAATGADPSGDAATATALGLDLAEFVAAVESQAGMWLSGLCQRSTGRVMSWRRTSEGGFNPRDYDVVRLPWKTAKAFVERHHYSGSFASAKLRYGLIRRRDDELVGVCVFGSPQRDEVLTNPLPTLDRTTATEWNRLILLDEVPANAESHFGGQALRDAREEGLKAVVTFADPVPRPDVGMPGHAGIIYQALNADYCGRSTAGDLLVLPSGAVLTRRAVQKVRAWEQGAGGVVRRFVDAGAPHPTPGEDGKAYLRRAVAAARPRICEHPGNHRFVIRLGTERERRRIPLGERFEPRRYPKRPDPVPVYR